MKSKARFKPPSEVGEWIKWAARRLKNGGLNFDNGLQNPREEAEYLVCHTLGISFESLPNRLREKVAAQQGARIAARIDLRCDKRMPVHYITQEAFFAGHLFHVDERVLIPRSRIENLFDDEEGFAALFPDKEVTRILDMGTGCGCIAICLALAFPQARVDAADISPPALEVAAINRERFGLPEERLRLVTSDLFGALCGERYDLIVTNPPYVPDATFANLPPEYCHEPEIAFRGGEAGLDRVLPILRQAPDHLTPGGGLVCEVGDEVEMILRQRFPELPLEWLYFHFGGSGVFWAQGDWLRESWGA